MDSIFETLNNNPMYVVLIIVLIIWIGLFFYLMRLDTRLKNIEKSQDSK